MTRSNAIIFDMDDTLYPERSFVLSGFLAASSYLANRSDVAPEDFYTSLLQLHDQGVRGVTFKQALVSYGVYSENLERALVDAYREHMPKLRPFDEVEPAIKRLSASFKIGLVTDGYLEVQKRKFTALGLEHYFDATVFSDEFGRDNWKPSKLPFKTVLERLGMVVPENAVYVGDNAAKDFLGPNQLGIKTIQLLQHGGEYARTKAPTAEHQPMIVVNSWPRLESAIADLHS